MPTVRLPELDTFLLPREGSLEASRKAFGVRATSATVAAATVDEERKHLHIWLEAADNVLQKMKMQTDQKRLFLKPCFQDFDKHNNGHVTLAQFRQCIHHLGLNFTDDEAHALEIKFGDQVGFNYTAFLEQLVPTAQDVYVYSQRHAERAQKTNQVVTPEAEELDVRTILQKMKDKVSKERIDTLQFMRDYDRLRSMRITREIFHRILDLCGFKLSSAEVHALQERYVDPLDRRMVLYQQLCDEMESIFTTEGLEKAPTVVAQQFQTTSAIDQNILQAEDELALEAVMMRVADEVRTRRIDLFPLFEDYDRVNNGMVTKSQFRRVLSELDLSRLITELEWIVLWKKFSVQVGGRRDYNYLAFCHTVNSLGEK